MKTLIQYLLFSVLLLSCAHEPPKGKTEAEVLFKEAKILIDDELYTMAVQKLHELKGKYPYSYYATPADLLLADIEFKQENYVEAAAAYMVFRDLHPKNKKLPYVIFRIAESYYLQMPDTVDRDLEPAVEAIKYFKEIQQKFPSSKYAKKSAEKISKAKKMLRGKEQYVADFYFKTKVYKAALWRYLDILNNIQDKKLREHSVIRILESAYELKKYNDCVGYAQKYAKEIRRKKDDFRDARDKCQSKARG
jgi:outer membrane protein assembly factor BamD